MGFRRLLEKSGIDRLAPLNGLDVGGRNVNGTVRVELPNTKWTGLDLRQGPDVDIVADAAEWRSDERYDIVIATELFEHAERWQDIIKTMWYHLDPAGPGVFISTCASFGRPAHDASGNHVVPPGEWYANVSPDDLRWTLDKYFDAVEVEYNAEAHDVYALAMLPAERDFPNSPEPRLSR
jgi:hypothetical protein